MKIDLSDLQRDFQIKTVNQNSDTKFDLDLKVSDLGTAKESIKHALATEGCATHATCCPSMACATAVC